MARVGGKHVDLILSCKCSRHVALSVISSALLPLHWFLVDELWHRHYLHLPNHLVWVCEKCECGGLLGAMMSHFAISKRSYSDPQMHGFGFCAGSVDGFGWEEEEGFYCNSAQMMHTQYKILYVAAAVVLSECVFHLYCIYLMCNHTGDGQNTLHWVYGIESNAPSVCICPPRASYIYQKALLFCDRPLPLPYSLLSSSWNLSMRPLTEERMVPR